MLWIIIIAVLIYVIFAPGTKTRAEKRKQAIDQEQGIIDTYNDELQDLDE